MVSCTYHGSSTFVQRLFRQLEAKQMFKTLRKTSYLVIQFWSAVQTSRLSQSIESVIKVYGPESKTTKSLGSNDLASRTRFRRARRSSFVSGGRVNGSLSLKTSSSETKSHKEDCEAIQEKYHGQLAGQVALRAGIKVSFMILSKVIPLPS